MGPDQIRARLAEITASLQEAERADGNYTEQDIENMNALSEEFEKLDTQLNTLEKVEAVKAKATASAGRKTQSAAPAATTTAAKPQAQRADRFGGFDSSGDWLMAVKKAGQTGEIDKRLNNVAYEKIGEDGGFLVPEEISQAILKKITGDDSLMSRTNTIQVSGNNLTINVDENAPWSGGIQAYWTGEGDVIKDSKPNFKQASWRLHKLAAMVKATDELLDDATALESYILTSAPAAIVHQLNKAILAGNGVGKPIGIINSPFTVTVPKESGQAADTVVAANILKMYSRMFPEARANAAWYINPAVEEQLRFMQDDNGNYIYLSPGSQMNSTPYGSLLGRPVIPLLAGIPALGDKGDIIFANLSYYYMIRKAAGIKSATSIHLHFDREITAFRFSLRVDGKCPYTSPVTTEFGDYQMSAFVQLEAR